MTLSPDEEIARIEALIKYHQRQAAELLKQKQRICQHEFKLNQVAGTGQTCKKCGLWDLNCDD